MFNQLKDFIKEISRYSLDAMNKNHQVDFKNVNKEILSIVTEVDLHNSLAFKAFAKENFSNLNYMIIDEESIDELGDDLFQKVENTEYQFVLDPIDGTINYSSGLPFYGILLAVFKRGKPLYGFIAAPALDELVYTDGEKLYRECHGKTQEIEHAGQNLSRVVQAHAWEIKLKPDHTKGNLIVEDYFSAAIYSLYLSLKQLRGAVVIANIWDLAPLMVISKIGNMGFYDYETEEEIEFSPKYFSNNGRMKNMAVVCSKEDIRKIKDVFSGIIK